MRMRGTMLCAVQSLWLMGGLPSEQVLAQGSASEPAPPAAGPVAPAEPSPGGSVMVAPPPGMGLGGAPGVSPGAINPMNPGNPLAPGQSQDELRDILPPVEIPFWTLRRKLLATGGGAVLVALTAYGVALWHRRVVPPPPPPDPTWVALTALRKLEGTEGEALSARDFAAAVAGVLRTFLEARHGIAAPRQTTEEFLEGVTRSNLFLLPVREQLRLFLRGCDELKFAGVHTTGRARTELVSAAVRMIEEGLA